MVRSLRIGTLVAILACTAPLWGQNMQPERTIVVREAGKPALKCRVIKCWKLDDGNKACQVQVIDSGEMITIVEEDIPVQPGKPKVSNSRVFHWGKQSQPRGVPLPPTNATVVGKIQPVPQTEAKQSPTLLGRLFGTGSTKTAKTDTCTVCTPVTTTPSQPQIVVKAETETAKSTDWRKSWGKVEEVKPDTTPSTAVVVSTRPDRPTLNKEELDPLNQPNLFTKMASGEAVDPAKEITKPVTTPNTTTTTTIIPNSTYTQQGLLQGRVDGPTTTSASKNVVIHTPAQPAAPIAGIQTETTTVEGTRLVPTAPQPMVKKPTKSWFSTGSSVKKSTPKPTPTKVVKTTTPKTVTGQPALWSRMNDSKKTSAPKGYEDDDRPDSLLSLYRRMTGPVRPVNTKTNGYVPGMAAYMASRSPEIDAVTPAGRYAMTSSGQVVYSTENYSSNLPSIPVGAPNAFTMTTGGMAGPTAMAWGGPQMMLPTTGVGAGLNNAFTNGGSTRPIPADFGYPDHGANAFLSGGVASHPFTPPPRTVAMGYGYPGMGYGYPAMGGYRYPAMNAGYPAPVQRSTAPVVQSKPETPKLLVQLQVSDMPSEREMAADKLATVDWRGEPSVLEALVHAAKKDPAPAVRASCIRVLGQMKASTPEVIQAMETLKTDTDTRVRQQVEQTLYLLTGK